MYLGGGAPSGTGGVTYDNVVPTLKGLILPI